MGSPPRSTQWPTLLVARLLGAIALSWVLVRWRLVRRPAPLCVVTCFDSLGDNLLINSLIAQAFERCGRLHIVVSPHPRIYRRTPGVFSVLSPRLRIVGLARLLGIKAYKPVYEEGPADTDRHVRPEGNIMDALASRMDLPPPIRREPLWTVPRGAVGPGVSTPRVGIMSGGHGARHPMLNKEWGSHNFQRCIDLLKGKCQFIQLGAEDDAPLHGAEDHRGANVFTELSNLLASCDLFVGQVGFLMHLARALNVPSVIVYGGRERAWQSGYPSNINLESEVECSPCWYHNRCEYDRKCLELITPEEVGTKIQEYLGSRNETLGRRISSPVPDNCRTETGTWKTSHGTQNVASIT